MNYSNKMKATVEAICIIGKSDKRINANAIADKLNVPARYLEQVMQKLTDDGILTSYRGPSGGYSLAKAVDKTNIRDVISCVINCDPKKTQAYG